MKILILTIIFLIEIFSFSTDMFPDDDMESLLIEIIQNY